MKVNRVKLTKEVFIYYRKNVKDNENISYDQATRKLTRNIQLAKEIPPRDESDIMKETKLYQYGNLIILVRNETVIRLWNHKGEIFTNDWIQDDIKYEEFNKKLSIAN
jgi:hypothetical protein